MPREFAGTADQTRVARLQEALRQWSLDALVCARPENVLLLTGYWPVAGTALALITQEGRVAVFVPEDELALAQHGRADEILTFAPAALDRLSGLRPALQAVMQHAAQRLKLKCGRLGFEYGPAFVPTSYAAGFRYGVSLTELLVHVWAPVTLVPADALLDHQRSLPTPAELERIRRACRIAEHAFRQGAPQLRPGLPETAAANLFHAPLIEAAGQESQVERADGFVFCMSGANAAQAYAAYQRSRAKPLRTGEPVLIHCNSYVDGFWTDITRTFCLGSAGDRLLALYTAILEARQAALEAIQPGVRAAAVDQAARDVLQAHGFAAYFKHATGHGVGFAAIDHEALPRLHPKAMEVLEPGMVCNVEPGLYLEDYGGIRHCDMVVVTDHGAEVLTPFQTRLEDLLLPATQAAPAARAAPGSSRPD